MSSPTATTCQDCGSADELRFGYCFDCAHAGEARIARRTVQQHIESARENDRRGRLQYARFDMQWAYQRLTRTGDYKKGGYFDGQGHNWRRGLT